MMVRLDDDLSFEKSQIISKEIERIQTETKILGIETKVQGFICHQDNMGNLMKLL